MRIDAIAFDMDDTLLRGDRTISPYTLSVLQRAAEQGIRVIPASGRARDSMKPFVEQIGCVSCYIACNGAEVWDGVKHTCLMAQRLPLTLVREVASFAEAEDCYAQCYYGEHFYYSRHGRYAEEYAASSMLTGEYVGQLSAWVTAPTAKVLMMADDDKIARMLTKAHAIFDGRAQVTCSKPYFLEINPIEATKGNALAFTGTLLGFDMKDTLTFGDSLNDMSMLLASGHGVAMENARDDVKARIKVICRSNEEDGVAQYIEENVLKGVSE